MAAKFRFAHLLTGAVLTAATMTAAGAVLVIGLAIGGLAAGLAAGQFTPRLPSLRDVARGLGGGVLLGWGAMTGLGCTVGVVLSGTMAGAVSGWAFAACAFLGVWLGLKAPLLSRLSHA